MEMGSSPRTVEEIFKDFSSRRDGIVRALTQGIFTQFNSVFFFLRFFKFSTNPSFFFFGIFVSDVDEFYALCDPGK
jgi:hypothetical protein